MDKPFKEQISGLSKLSRPELVVRFRHIFRKNPGSRASRELLSLAIAYRLQEEVEGGLSEQARRRLNRGASYRTQDSNRTNKPPPLRFKPGTRILKSWKGNGHQVTVLESGFEYEGQRYGSLSQIARAITGTRWSGPAFFGLKKPQPQEVPHG